jgi:8-oxo-dGTP pyrophosphatase MutT (NUDIX family)
MSFAGSHLWHLRQVVGSRLLLVPGAQVLVFDDGERVLLQRESGFGRWCLPGGSCEEGQTFASAAAAELREETGLVVDEDALTPFACLSDPAVHVLRYPNGDRVHSFAMCFEARRWHGELRPEPGEVEELEFFELGALPAPMNPPTVVVLGLYAEFRRTGCFQAR